MKPVTTVLNHYDLLIDEGNDPVQDPPPLKEYMDGWDGAPFLKRLELSGTQQVLEIGVGTGRLAVQVAPRCRSFWGIDLSPKTIRRARENLSAWDNVNLVCGDFLECHFEDAFDVIYSSLTFLHIEEKEQAVSKVAQLLAPGGRFVLSIDKNQETFLDYGTRRLSTYPDTARDMVDHLQTAGLTILEQLDRPFATILVAEKEEP